MRSARARSTTTLHGRTTSFAVRVAPLGPGVGGGGLVLLLVEDQTERRRVEEVRRDFVANTSHELKTPVGALALLAETVEDAADDPEAVRRFAGRMRQEANRLTNLVQDMITLSRIQAAEPIPDPLPSTWTLVAEALDRGRMKATSRGIELAATGTRRLSVLGDEELLITALRNLLDNAVAYSPEKTKVVVSPQMAGDDIVEISVERPGDRHPGAGPRADLRALLPRRPGPLPGHRGHRARARDRQARDGRPRRQSDGDGARKVPDRPSRCDCPPGRLGRCAAPRPTASSRPHLRRQSVTRVLVVEDEESFSDALSYMLRKEGFEVAVAADRPGRARHVRPHRR